MRSIRTCVSALAFGLLSIALSSCATHNVYPDSETGVARSMRAQAQPPGPPPNYAARLPQHINTREKTILVDPNVHAWGAYNSQGELIKAGLATAGSSWCSDIGRPCKTKPGTFRVNSLGARSCKSSMYPLPRGGAPMPYCMFFNRHQGLHGSYNVVEGNASHGCVRMQVSDAEWVRFNFANVGTKVIVRPY